MNSPEMESTWTSNIGDNQSQDGIAIKKSFLILST